uniref:Uncharacterized protein n=1 Tax=Anopheles atroparvus TaxID=41427 RepID=A0A182IWN2_ANOAO
MQQSLGIRNDTPKSVYLGNQSGLQCGPPKNIMSSFRYKWDALLNHSNTVALVFFGKKDQFFEHTVGNLLALRGRCPTAQYPAQAWPELREKCNWKVPGPDVQKPEHSGHIRYGEESSCALDSRLRARDYINLTVLMKMTKRISRDTAASPVARLVEAAELRIDLLRAAPSMTLFCSSSTSGQSRLVSRSVTYRLTLL